MKYLIMILALATAGLSYGHGLESCEIKLEPMGYIYSRYCPKGSVMDANGTRVHHVGNSIFVYDDVRCVKPVLVCGDKNKLNVDEDMREQLPVE